MNIKCTPLGQLGANFCLVTDDESRQCFVADPGAEPNKAAKIIEESGYELKYIIITHAHADHICALDELKRKYGVPVVINKNDAKSLNDANWNLCNAFGLKSPETKADITVEDNDVLPFGNSEIKFIHTPGHTKGSMCILADEFLISGDTLFCASVGRTDFMGGDYNALVHSIKDKLFALDENTKVYPGHGEATTILFEKHNNPYI